MRQSEREAARIARTSGDALWIFGSLQRNRERRGRKLFNVAVAARRGKTVAAYRKRLLPTYDVFDEGRYVEPGDEPLALRIRGQRAGVTICEDIWNDKTFWDRPLYDQDPIADLKRLGISLHVNISASPYSLGKDRLRERMMRSIALRTRTPLVVCNLVGGNDGLVFDGASIAFDGRGRLLARGKSFEEDFWVIEVPGKAGPKAPRKTELAKLRAALVLALSDYASKCGFSRVVLGLSGGVDSALTAALAVEALGPSGVVGVAMPGPYSSKGSLTRRAPARRAARHRDARGPDHTGLRGLPQDARAGLRGGRLPGSGGEPPGTHPRRHAHGALEPVWLARAVHRQQVRDRDGLQHALRGHGRRLRSPLRHPEDPRLRDLPRHQPRARGHPRVHADQAPIGGAAPRAERQRFPASL